MRDELPDALMGIVEMVHRPNEREVWIIGSSYHDDDRGGIFVVEMRHKHYQQVLWDYSIKTLRGCVIEIDDGDMEIIDEPPEPVASRTDLPLHRAGKGAVVQMPAAAKWPWGRCCCVPHPEDGEPTPVTERTIAEERVDWWASPRTPFEIDLVTSAEPDAPLMVVHEEYSCPVCGHILWTIDPEEFPDNEMLRDAEVAQRGAAEATATRVREILDEDADELLDMLDDEFSDDEVADAPAKSVRTTLEQAEATIIRLEDAARLLREKKGA